MSATLLPHAGSSVVGHVLVAVCAKIVLVDWFDLLRPGDSA